VALAAPLALGLFPRVRLPAIVLEIVLGIVLGPQVLGWVSIDTPIQVMSLLGLAFLVRRAGEVSRDVVRVVSDVSVLCPGLVVCSCNKERRAWMRLITTPSS
jgi:Sodium/hydrogen exchanger family